MAHVPVSAHASFPGANGRFAISSSGIGTVNSDGSCAIGLTTSGYNSDTGAYQLDINPSWSSDSSKIAFARGTNSGYELFTMNADGTSERRLTNSTVDESSPSWSPDGQRIIYEIVDGSTPSGLAIVSSSGGSGTAFAPYTTIGTGGDRGDSENRIYIDGSEPVWSPDEASIAFVGQVFQDNDIFIADAETGSSYAVTVADPETSDGMVRLEDASPTWSPDGSRIAFIRNTFDDVSSSSTSDLFVVNKDGTELRELVSGSSSLTLRDPTWSPDGTKIAFARYDETTNVERLVTIPAGGGSAAVVSDVHAQQDSLDPDWGSNTSCDAPPDGGGGGDDDGDGGGGGGGTSTATSLSLNIRKTRRNVIASGRLSPLVPGSLIRVKLINRSRTLRAKFVNTDATGAYVTKLRRNRGGMCTVAVSYAGNDSYSPSENHKSFRC